MAGVENIAGKVTPQAASTAGCGVIMQPGVEPTSPEIGGFWYDDSADCLAYFRKDGLGVYLYNDNGVADQVLTSNGDALPTFKTHPAHLAGGSDKQLQVNNATAFGGISNGNADEVLVSNGAAVFPSFKVFGKVLYGAVAPTTEGVNGDFYIDTVTNTLYGPKASGTWPGGVSIVGPTGAAGADGLGYSVLAKRRRDGVVHSNITTITAITASPLVTPPNAMNTLAKRLTFKGSGFFTTDTAETPTLTFTMSATGLALAIPTAALTAELTQKPFQWEFNLVTDTIGASGYVSWDGVIRIQLDGTTWTEYRVQPFAVVGTVDLTSSLNFIMNITATSNLKSAELNEAELRVA